MSCTSPACSIGASAAGQAQPAKITMRRLRGHTAMVHCVAVTPNSRRALSSSDDKTIRVWDLVTGEEVQQWRLGSAAICLAISPDNEHVAGGLADRTTRVWRLADGIEECRWDGGADFIAITPDSQYVVTNDSRTIGVWTLMNGERVRKWRAFDPFRNYELSGLAITPDGQQIVSRASDDTFRVWDLSSKREVCIMSGGGLFHIATTPNGLRMISLNRDCLVS